MIIPYHTIPRARLRVHTESYLAQCSIPATSWGPCGATTTALGSLHLSAYARELLPAGAGGSASPNLEGFSPGTRKAFAGSTDSLRRRLEGSMHLEEFGTPAPDPKGGVGGKTKSSSKSGGTDRKEGEGSRERDSEREAGDALRAPPGVGDTARLAEAVVLTEGTTAIGLLLAIWARFPLITEAMRTMQDLSEPTVLSDFPTLTLVEAAYAAKLQLHGYDILKDSAGAGAPAAGAEGVVASDSLGDLFDYEASEAILRGDIILNISPLEATLGVLPLLQIGLHFWYQSHREQAAAGSEVLKAAVRMNLAPGGRFDPRQGLRAFRAAWAVAMGQKATLPHHDIYCALARAVAAAPSHDCAEVRGVSVSLDKLRLKLIQGLAQHSADERYTSEQLTKLRRDLEDFASAHGSERGYAARYSTAAVNLVGLDGTDPPDEDSPSVCSLAAPPTPPLTTEPIVVALLAQNSAALSTTNAAIFALARHLGGSTRGERGGKGRGKGGPGGSTHRGRRAPHAEHDGAQLAQAPNEPPRPAAGTSPRII